LYTSRNIHEVSKFGIHGNTKERWYLVMRNNLRFLSNMNLMSTRNIVGYNIYLHEKLVMGNIIKEDEFQARRKKLLQVVYCKPTT
jgi:hypothetical protein